MISSETFAPLHGVLTNSHIARCGSTLHEPGSCNFYLNREKVVCLLGTRTSCRRFPECPTAMRMAHEGRRANLMDGLIWRRYGTGVDLAHTWRKKRGDISMWMLDSDVEQEKLGPRLFRACIGRAAEFVRL